LVLLGVVAATLLFVLGAGVVHFRAAKAWRAVQHAAQQNLAERSALDTTRPPLWGETRDGLAFAEYGRGIALARDCLDADHEAFTALRRLPDDQLVAAAAELRARWQPMLAALHAGAHCRDARPPGVTAAGKDQVLDLLATRELANAAVLEARLRLLQRERRAAVGWTLDAATLGADLCQRGLLINQMIGCAVLAIATREAWPDAALGALDADGLALFGSGLARLDERLQPCLHFVDDLAAMAADAVAAPTAPDLGWRWSLLAWRHAFSCRWMTADALLHVFALARGLGAVDANWPARCAAYERMCAAALRSSNPYVGVCVPNFRAAEQNLRETIAEVRMLRVAVALHQGLPLALADPLGEGPLQVEVAAGRTRISSVAADDQGARVRVVSTP
jgi:hypothetical protein